MLEYYMVVLMADEKVAVKVDHLVDMRDNLMTDELVEQQVDMLEYYMVVLMADEKVAVKVAVTINMGNNLMADELVEQ